MVITTFYKIYFSLISQFVYVFLPGRQPFNYYFCSNKIKHWDLISGAPVKNNWPLIAIQAFSVLLHIFAKIRITIFKNKQKNSESNPWTHVKANGMSIINKQTIANTGTNAFITFIFFSTGLVSIPVNTMHLQDANQFPTYLFIYFVHWIHPALLCWTLTIVYFITHPPLRKTIQSEIKLMMGFKWLEQ
jgi:hypothetical protein